MDVVGKIQVEFTIMKEPRGFIRIIQLVLAIFAFATICTSARATIQLSCRGESGATNYTKDLEIEYKYPFRIKNVQVDTPFCMKSTEKSSPFQDISFAPAAEFFCFIGVMSFLLCIGYVIGYILFTGFFATKSMACTVDFVFSAVWALLWFIASCAWADRLTFMGVTMDPSTIIQDLQGVEYCQGPMVLGCSTGTPGNHATLIVSVLFGFLNFLVWVAGLWFLFKETKWHRESSDDLDRFDAPNPAESNTDSSYQSAPGAGTTTY